MIIWSGIDYFCRVKFATNISSVSRFLTALVLLVGSFKTIQPAITDKKTACNTEIIQEVFLKRNSVFTHTKNEFYACYDRCT